MSVPVSWTRSISLHLYQENPKRRSQLSANVTSQDSENDQNDNHDEKEVSRHPRQGSSLDAVTSSMADVEDLQLINRQQPTVLNNVSSQENRLDLSPLILSQQPTVADLQNEQELWYTSETETLLLLKTQEIAQSCRMSQLLLGHLFLTVHTVFPSAKKDHSFNN